MSEFIQQGNGYTGEERSKGLIPRDFWVLTRSVDAEAADLMVQSGYADAGEARARRGEPLQLASIQAKFFEGTNQVDIPNKYLYNGDGTVRKGFLVFLHTEDEDENHVNYLFTAQEIVDEWNPKENEEGFYFSLKAGRKYLDFRNIGPKRIRAKLSSAIAENSAESMSWGWSKASDTYSSVRDPQCLEPKYRLVRLGQAAIALFEGGFGQLPHPLEPRKDVCPYFGTFNWGSSGRGCRLLAASILTHFLCGRRPTNSEIDRIVNYLVSRVEFDKDVNFGKQEIFKALAYVPFNTELTELILSRTDYWEIAREYSVYFDDPTGIAGPPQEGNAYVASREENVEDLLDENEGEEAPRQ